VQTPHPPVRIAANSPGTFPLAARHRLPIFASPLINPPDKLKAGLVVYRQGLPAGTVDDTALAFPVHVASSRAQTREPGLLRFLRPSTRSGGRRPKSAKARLTPRLNPHRARGTDAADGELADLTGIARAAWSRDPELGSSYREAAALGCSV